MVVVVVGVALLTRATAEGIWTKFGLDFPHTPGKVISYVVGVAGGRSTGMGGRGNIDPRNCWRDLDQTWHEGFPHPEEGYRLCGERGR